MSDAELVLSEVRAVLADLHRDRRGDVTLQSDLAGDLGLDSLAIVELHDRLEQAFDITLPDDVLATAATPGDWLEAIVKAKGLAVHRPTTDLSAAQPEGRRARGAWPEMARTLTEALTWHAEQHPDRVSIRLLSSHGQDPPEELAYGPLANESATIARGLVGEGLGQGERVAIMLPTGRDYFSAFLGTLLGGGIPVPIYPAPNPALFEQHLDRQMRLLEDAGVSVLIAGPDARVTAPSLCSRVPSLRAVCIPADLGEVGREPRQLPTTGADDTALIQYTSGSTSDPKGVVLSHAQILANVHALGQAVDVSTGDVFVSWLPLYHDMGLIGAWHASLLFGFPLVLLSPLQFLARPASWLEAISAHSGTLSAAPNFAYQACVDRIRDKELEGVDLSSWRIAFNGSEPVSASTIDQFATRFEPYGFRRGTMCPAYGLAEVGVGLTLTPLGRGPRVDVLERDPLQASGDVVRAAPGQVNAVAVVGCGTAAPGYELRVTDAHGHPLHKVHEGRIQCRGPSATRGYFGDAAASRALWSHGWLDTGDLGYVRNGELFLTGRAKDLIIRGGRNLHPEDLEQALAELAGVDPDGVAAFASVDPDHGTERIVVVIETALETSGARDALRVEIGRRAAEVVGAAPDEIVLVPGGSILRTPSLKIRRGATRTAFEGGLFSPGRAATRVPRTGVPQTGAPPAGACRRSHGGLGSWAFGAYVWVLVALIGLPLWLAVQPAPARLCVRPPRPCGAERGGRRCDGRPRSRRSPSGRLP